MVMAILGPFADPLIHIVAGMPGGSPVDRRVLGVVCEV
jgi:hypothetical protein